MWMKIRDEGGAQTRRAEQFLGPCCCWAHKRPKHHVVSEACIYLLAPELPGVSIFKSRKPLPAASPKAALSGWPWPKACLSCQPGKSAPDSLKDETQIFI